LWAEGLILGNWGYYEHPRWFWMETRKLLKIAHYKLYIYIFKIIHLWVMVMGFTTEVKVVKCCAPDTDVILWAEKLTKRCEESHVLDQ